MTVATDAEDARSFRLRFTVEAHSPITARPRFSVVVNGIEGEAGKGRILLHRVDGDELELEEIESSNSSLVGIAIPVHERVKEGEVTAEPGDVWLEVVSDPRAASTRDRGTITLSTNDPMAPRIVIPFTLRILPLIEARPEVVRMWPSPSNSSQGRTSLVGLKQNREGEFAITSVEVSNPEIFSVTADSTDAATKQMLRVVLASELTREKMTASVHGWIKVGTDEPDRPFLTIPVIVAPTRRLSRQAPKIATGDGNAATLPASEARP